MGFRVVAPARPLGGGIDYSTHHREMVAEVMEQFAQYGLVGLMIGGIYLGIAWGGKRLLGKDGLLEGHNLAMQKNADAIESVAVCMQEKSVFDKAHTKECDAANANVRRIHHAAVIALDEIEAECRAHGFDVADRCNRVRRELSNEE